MKSGTPSLSIVVPCYNEDDAFPHCLSELQGILLSLISKGKIEDNSYILFVDDGSKDNTWEKIRHSAKKNKLVRGIKLSRNQGHQLALLSGLSNVDTDVSISIDADLQDDTSCIEEMLDKHQEGFDVVYGVRNNRDSDSRFKRFTANTFYLLMSKMGVNQVENHADFRLLSKRAMASLSLFREQSVYLRGLIPLIGYRSTSVFYSREERVAGESKYPLRKMISLAWEGVTSLTVTPLRLISLVGLFSCLISLISASYAMIEKMRGDTVDGWTSVIIAIFFLGGVQMISLGVIGEYIGKIYLESKKRPKFFVEEKAGSEG